MDKNPTVPTAGAPNETSPGIRRIAILPVRDTVLFPMPFCR